MNRDVRILLVPQTILHDRSYSASECVCVSHSILTFVSAPGTICKPRSTNSICICILYALAT